LQQWPLWLERQKRAKTFAQLWAACFEAKPLFVSLFSEQLQTKNTYLQYPVYYLKKNNLIKEKLKKYKIDVNIDFFQNIAQLESFKDYETECPNCADLVQHLVLFPTYTKLDPDYIRYATQIIGAMDD
jgi:dTDP-4-amino-4,6-dideoxygalactose transaminase